MSKTRLALTTNAALAAPFEVDLPMVSDMLNEQLFEIGMWLIDREIAHQARVLIQPAENVVRISFRTTTDATAFRAFFGLDQDISGDAAAGFIEQCPNP
jgi:hypothetical protein